jgi:hypothetical protein
MGRRNRLRRGPLVQTRSSACVCSPHSLPFSFSHHQRPALMSSPGLIARVHGWHPMDKKPGVQR